MTGSVLEQQYDNQVQIIIDALNQATLTGGFKTELGTQSKLFKKAVEWIGNWPVSCSIELKDKLMYSITEAFHVTKAQVYAAMEGVEIASEAETRLVIRPSSEEQLKAFMPKGGWFEDYEFYTKYTESPYSYHMFSSLVALAAALGRRVYLPFGHSNILCNMCVVLIGRTGIIKKSSACDIAKQLIAKAAVCPILPEKMTPEAMVAALVEHGGHQFLHIPEFTNFLNKQRYNEGLSIQIIRLLDSSDPYEVRTVSHGVQTISNLSISILGGSTESLLASAAPQEVTSSGFLNRFILVPERETDRCFPIPAIGLGVEQRLIQTLKRMQQLKGAVILSKDAMKWYEAWYRERWLQQKTMQDDVKLEVIARSPQHILRIASIIHLAECDNLHICERCILAANGMMQYVEDRLPRLLRGLKSSAVAQDSDYILAKLARLGGAASHSDLLRQVSNKFNSATFKQHIRTLEELGAVKVGRKGSGVHYVLIDKETI